MYKNRCIICGEEFETRYKRRRICSKQHYKKCSVCGKEFPINLEQWERGKLTCSRECQNKQMTETKVNKTDKEKAITAEKRKKVNLEKYGVEYASQNKEIQKKMSDSWKIKSKEEVMEIQQRRRDGMVRKYGKEYTVQVPELLEKQQRSCEERYGVKNPFESNEIKEKIKQTNLEKYGVEYILQADEIKEKIKQTNLEKWGVENPSQAPEIKKKKEETCLKHYGAKNPMQVKEICEQISNQNRNRYINTMPSERGEKFKQFTESPAIYIKETFNKKPTIQQITKSMGVDRSCIDRYIKRSNTRDLISYYQSKMEIEVKNVLLSIDDNLEIIEHDRQIIAPMELDFYLPEYRVAIECNPTYTHNSTRGTYTGEPKSIKYHQEKSLKCEEKGIFLFHIYGYEWTVHREIIESMIRNLLNKNTRKIYARNCYVDEIGQNEFSLFLENNHRQGAVMAKYRLGLRDKKTAELVSVMGFKKVRNTVKGAKGITENTIELTRFCSLLNTTVVGGASKMFKYFIEKYKFDKIISYSDISHTKGGVYKKLGFKVVSNSQPTYRWVNLQTDEELNREKCRKEKLLKLFNEPELDIKNKTETQIMEEHGYVKVYDSGLTRWEYSKGRKTPQILSLEEKK